MPDTLQLLFNAFGPRAPSDLRNEMFPVLAGKASGRLPGCEAKFSGNAMSAGKAGMVCHFKLDGLIEKDINVRGRVLDSEGTFCILVQLSGSCKTRLEGGTAVINAEPGTATLFSYAQDAMHSVLAPGYPFENIGFSFSGGFLLAMLEGERAPQMLKKALAEGRFGAPLMAERLSTLAMSRIAREAAAHPYHGTAEELYLQAKMLELLAEVVCVDSGGRKGNGHPREIIPSQVADARDIMTLNPHNPPPAMDLAQMVGVGYQTLNRGFIKYYGQTVYQFAKEIALESSKRALEQTDMTVAQVAYQHGYANPSAFITAYRRRFGAPPGASRKSGDKS